MGVRAASLRSVDQGPLVHRVQTGPDAIASGSGAHDRHRASQLRLWLGDTPPGAVRQDGDADPGRLGRTFLAPDVV